MRLEEMAARTPADRDRYVDFLRAFSITVVVLGHWLIAIINYSDDYIRVYSAVGVTSGLWLLTWVLQVMPLFFFVGGFSNLKTYEASRRKGESYLVFMRARLARLLKPTLVFLGVWVAIQIVLHLLDVGGTRLIRVSFLPFGPLWFLVVYMVVVALTPVMVALHRKLRLWVPVAMVAGVAVVDAIRFRPWEDLVVDFAAPERGLPWVVWLNLAFVWLTAHQLGFFYGDGSLVRAGRKLHVAMALGGLTGLIVLTNIGLYPRSMVGTDIERVSNMNPPTLCIVALTVWLVGIAMLLRETVNRWLAEKRPWMAVIAANSVIMTVFLWHLSAFLVAILLLYPLGLGRPSDTTVTWWVQKPVWIAASALVLAVLVVIFGRFERPRRAPT